MPTLKVPAHEVTGRLVLGLFLTTSIAGKDILQGWVICSGLIKKNGLHEDGDETVGGAGLW